MKRCKRQGCDRALEAAGLCRPHYLYQVRMGKFPRAGVVDAGPAKAHLGWLTSQGLSLCEIVRLSGVNHMTVGHLVHGRLDRIFARSEDRILATRPAALMDRDAGWADPVGTVRRLRALAAAGYDQRYLAKRLGSDQKHIGTVMRDQRTRVGLRFAKQVAGLFTELELIPGPSDRARSHAKRKGWAPPLAWDENRIDDPVGRPHVARKSAATRLDEYRDLKDMGLADDRIAQRMGIKQESLEQLLRRAS